MAEPKLIPAIFADNGHDENITARNYFTKVSSCAALKGFNLDILETNGTDDEIVLLSQNRKLIFITGMLLFRRDFSILEKLKANPENRVMGFSFQSQFEELFNNANLENFIIMDECSPEQAWEKIEELLALP
jgi:hypothetical protein